MSLAQTPPGLPLTRRSPRRARLSGAAGGGLPCQPRSARRSAAAPASGIVPGPWLGHTRWEPTGPQRSPAGRRSTGRWRHPGKPDWVSADKDEVPGPSPGRPTNQPSRSRPPRLTGLLDHLLAHLRNGFEAGKLLGGQRRECGGGRRHRGARGSGLRAGGRRRALSAHPSQPWGRGRSCSGAGSSPSSGTTNPLTDLHVPEWHDRWSTLGTSA
jgi:hypothetical protein